MVVGDPVAVVHGERVENGFPACDLSCEVLPVLSAGDGNEVEDFHRCLLVGEMPTVADPATESCVETLDRVRRVDDLAELDWKFQERDELVPAHLP